MNVRRVAWTAAVGGVLLIVLAQLVPYGPDRSARVRTAEPVWDSPRTRDLAARACFDCHSAETRWPWYGSIAPVSWIVRSHVDEGRAVLDFSRWDAPGVEAHDAAEAVLEGTMPPAYYTLLHPASRLGAEERDALIRGLRATIGGAGSSESGHHEDEENEADEARAPARPTPPPG